MKRNLIILPLIFITLAFCSFAQKPTTTPESAKKPVYDELLAKLKGGDTSIDFKALRIAFTETKDSSPYGSDRDAKKTMLAALNEKRYKDALKSADEILKTNFVNMDAHVAEAIAYRELGDSAKADFHKAIYLGLVNSIINGADGKTTKTAYVVISTEEEYTVMRSLGISPSGQSLVHDGDHTFDILTGTDQNTRESVKIYFNIDIVWKAETDMFKN